MAIALIAVGFATLIVLTFGELLVVHSIPRWLRYVGFSLASLSGELADGYSELPLELAGLDVTRLDDRTYLVETREAGSAPTVADANTFGLAFAIVEVERGRWTMNVRANRGYQLIGMLAPCIAIWQAMTRPLSMPGSVGALALAALFPYAVLRWRRSVRARFTAAAQVLSAVHTADVREPASSL